MFDFVVGCFGFFLSCSVHQQSRWNPLFTSNQINLADPTFFPFPGQTFQWVLICSFGALFLGERQSDCCLISRKTGGQTTKGKQGRLCREKAGSHWCYCQNIQWAMPGISELPGVMSRSGWECQCWSKAGTLWEGELQLFQRSVTPLSHHLPRLVHRAGVVQSCSLLPPHQQAPRSKGS